jgi:hypothetical protein
LGDRLLFFLTRHFDVRNHGGLALAGKMIKNHQKNKRIPKAGLPTGADR